MPSIFTKIVNGEIPSYKVYEDKNYLAFLDVSPLVEGHTLLIPKQEIDYIFDLDDELLTGLTLASKKVAKAIAKAIPCNRIGTTVIGLEVPHAHVHLIPIHTMGDMNFSNKKRQFTKEEFTATAEKIRQFL